MCTDFIHGQGSVGQVCTDDPSEGGQVLVFLHLDTGGQEKLFGSCGLILRRVPCLETNASQSNPTCPSILKFLCQLMGL